jgi:hypothetical protein
VSGGGHKYEGCLGIETEHGVCGVLQVQGQQRLPAIARGRGRFAEAEQMVVPGAVGGVGRGRGGSLLRGEAAGAEVRFECMEGVVVGGLKLNMMYVWCVVGTGRKTCICPKRSIRAIRGC